jgi:hypothetical protein
MELPIFPAGVVMVNERLAVEKRDGMVYYFNYQNPIHVHIESDRNSFRYITASLILSGMCKIHELAKALGIKRRNLERYSKHLKESGMSYFFAAKHTGGKAHIITPDKLSDMQNLLDQGENNVQIAKKHEISEAAVRYYLKKGDLKKRVLPPNQPKTPTASPMSATKSTLRLPKA